MACSPRLIAVAVAATLTAGCSGSTNSPFSPAPAASPSRSENGPSKHGLATKAASDQAFTVIHDFSGSDGANPHAGLTIDAAGNLYGTTQAGGSGYGNVFQLKYSGSAWTLSPLYTFTGGSDGAFPQSRVVIGPDGNLYGTTEGGGIGAGCHQCGTVFKLTRPATVCKGVSCPWTETVLYRFSGGSDGGWPTGDLTFDRAGNIYSTTSEGGLFPPQCGYGCGVAYELTGSGGSWRETVLHEFAGGNDGSSPFGGVAFDPSGNLYGTTTDGGTLGYGTVFTLKPSGSGWSESTIASLPSNAEYPVTGVISDASGNLYGTTVEGGGTGGTVFELMPSQGSWTFTVIHTFTGNEGPYANLSMDAAGNIYGTTNQDGPAGFGSVFKLTSQGGGWTFNDVYDFTGGVDGEYPYSGVAFDTTGNLYGTAYGGGSHRKGVIFEITPTSQLRHRSIPTK